IEKSRYHRVYIAQVQRLVAIALQTIDFLFGRSPLISSQQATSFASLRVGIRDCITTIKIFPREILQQLDHLAWGVIPLCDRNEPFPVCRVVRIIKVLLDDFAGLLLIVKIILANRGPSGDSDPDLTDEANARVGERWR